MRVGHFLRVAWLLTELRKILFFLESELEQVKTQVIVT